MENIEEFVAKLAEDKGLGGEDPEVLAQIKKDLMDRVENSINAMVVSELPPEKLVDFEKLLDSGSEGEIQGFVKECVPDIDEKVAAELLNFKNIYLG